MGYWHLVNQALSSLPGEWDYKIKDNYIIANGTIDDVKINVFATDNTLRISLVGFPFFIYVRDGRFLGPVEELFPDIPSPDDNMKGFLEWYIMKAIEIYEKFSDVNFQEMEREITRAVVDGEDVYVLGTYMIGRDGEPVDLTSSHDQKSKKQTISV